MTFIKRIESMGRRMKELQRFRDILRVFMHYDFDDLAHKLHIPSIIGSPIKTLVDGKDPEIAKLSQPEKLRRMCEELGPTFTKLGQILSTRPNLLPREYVDELSKLHSHSAPLPFAKIQSILTEELGTDPETIFKEIIEEPLGAASIAQVHKAKLPDGKEVVIKVQRPGIADIMEQDLEILEYLASLMEHYLESWRVHHPRRIVEEFAGRLSKELDFSLEASHIQRFQWQFHEDPTLFVPKVYGRFSSQRVLVMDYVAGKKITDWNQHASPGEKTAVAETIAQSIMAQVFLHGFFHADPHPGNIHVMPDLKICFLDFGMMGFLDFRTREAFADLLWSITQRNETGVSHALLRMSSYESEPDMRQMESDIAEFIHQNFYRPISEIHFGSMLSQLLAITGKYGLRLGPDIFILLKTLSHTESLLTQLCPERDLAHYAAPFIKKIRLNRINPKNVAGSLYDFGVEFSELIKDLPAEVRRIIGHVKKGEAKVAFKHDGLEPLTSSWDRVSNRLSYSVVLASLIIGSSLLVHADIPPKWYDIPVIGLIGFVVAAFMGFWLLVSILRHGRM
ncbi:MAG: ABC1 kinase family protein [Verrucomicrobiota bacterium]